MNLFRGDSQRSRGDSQRYCELCVALVYFVVNYFTEVRKESRCVAEIRKDAAKIRQKFATNCTNYFVKLRVSFVLFVIKIHGEFMQRLMSL